MNDNLIPRPEHPNPQWERNSWVNLNGKWQFEIDYGSSGENRNLHKQTALSGEIIVPFCPESSLSGVGNKDFMPCVWYKKSVRLDKTALAGKRVILHFGAADFATDVWVNGESAGLTHVGGYGSFSYDVTNLITDGENVITVRCQDDVRSGRQGGGKQSPRYESFRCFYTRTTGIWQTVWYEIVPESYVSHAYITPDLNNCSVSVRAELVGSGDLTVEAYYEGRLVGKTTKRNLSGVGNVDVELSEKHVWELGCGRLYDLVIKFGEDEVKSYFGLREVKMDGMRFMLNGKSVFMRLVLDQGYYHDGIITAPNEQMLITDIECGLSAGFNGARLHQKVFEPRYLYHCDRLGYMAWGEYGNWGLDYSDIANLSTFLPDWLSAVKRDYNHPSIVGWCPFNETWDYGKYDPSKGLKRQDNMLLRIVYEQTKLLDPARPCIDTSGNFHVVTDIFDVHDYEQNPEIFRANYDKLVTENVLFDKYSDRQTYRGEPVFMSEYGGIGFCLTSNDFDTTTRTTSWSYGKSTYSYEEFYARYEGLTYAMLDNPKMCGFCYTQLTDVEQEVNGLFEFETRKPKFDMSILSAINKKKAAIED